MHCSALPAEIFCSKPLMAVKLMSRPLPQWMYSRYSTALPRSTALKPAKISSDTCSVRDALDTPPEEKAHTLSHMSGWP